MNKKLINAVIRQLGGRESLQDVANHGANNGFGGFIYYSDTIKFFKKNKSEIINLVKEMSKEFGQSPIEFVKSFNCINIDEDTEAEIARALYGRIAKDDIQIPNALAWFALEEVARHETEK